MKLYLARHGRTNYNDLHLCNSDPSVDVHLTPLGVQQAEALAQKLLHTDLDHVFVSELRRTQQTAALVNKHHNAPVTVEPLLNDIRTGFENKTSSAYRDALHHASDPTTARFNDGESLQDIKERAQHFIDWLRDQKYQSVLIVTSAFLVQAMYEILQGLPTQSVEDYFGVGEASCLELDLPQTG